MGHDLAGVEARLREVVRRRRRQVVITVVVAVVCLGGLFCYRWSDPWPLPVQAWLVGMLVLIAGASIRMPEVLWALPGADLEPVEVVSVASRDVVVRTSQGESLGWSLEPGARTRWVVPGPMWATTPVRYGEDVTLVTERSALGFAWARPATPAAEVPQESGPHPATSTAHAVRRCAPAAVLAAGRQQIGPLQHHARVAVGVAVLITGSAVVAAVTADDLLPLTCLPGPALLAGMSMRPWAVAGQAVRRASGVELVEATGESAGSRVLVLRRGDGTRLTWRMSRFGAVPRSGPLWITVPNGPGARPAVLIPRQDGGVFLVGPGTKAPPAVAPGADR